MTYKLLSKYPNFWDKGEGEEGGEKRQRGRNEKRKTKNENGKGGETKNWKGKNKK